MIATKAARGCEIPHNPENPFEDLPLLADQAGRAGSVQLWPADSENQPHHAGAALIWGPDGELLASTQEELIRDEMIVATLDAGLLARERALANYMLRTRRPELFGELVREQVSC